LPESGWRKPIIKKKGKKINNKLPNGVCSLYVRKSSKIIQQIYGSIKELNRDKTDTWL